MQSDLPPPAAVLEQPPIYQELCDQLLFDPLPPTEIPEVERVRPRTDLDATGEPIR